MIGPSFQGVYRLLVSSFENNTSRTRHAEYFLPAVEIKDYIMIDEQNCFDQPVKTDTRTNQNIRKIATGRGNEHTIGCLLDYPYFKENYKLISIDLSKEQALDADIRRNTDIKRNQNIRKIITCLGDDYTTGCLLYYPHFKENDKLIAIDLTKEHALDAYPKTMQQINFIGNLNRTCNTIMFSIIVKAREVIPDFSQETVKVL